MSHDAAIILQVVEILLALVTFCVVAFNRPSRCQQLLLLAAVCTIFSTLGYYLELESTELEYMIPAVKIQYIGNSFSMLLLLAFVHYYFEGKLRKNWIVPAFVVHCIFLIIIGTFNLHHLFYREYFLDETGSYPAFGTEKGIVFYVLMALIFLEYLMICHYVLVEKWKTMDKAMKQKMISLVLIATIPIVCLAVYLTGFLGRYDPISFSSLLANLIIIFVVKGLHIFDTMDAAKDDLLQKSTEGLIVVDKNYKIILTNPAAELLFPVLKDLKQRDKDEELRSLILGINPEFQKNGRFYETRLTVINNQASIEGYMLWMFDVTMTHNYMENILELKEQAEAANKAKTQFLANTSHEIRTPMNAILGMAQMILFSTKEEETRKSVLNIKTAGESLIAIINDILDISKIESGKMELMLDEYEPLTLLNELYNMFSVKLSDKSIQFIIQNSEDIPCRLIGDEVRIKQILVNLLNNAVKFTEEGKITLDIEWKQERNETYLKCRVSDTGIGIRQEDMGKLFTKFQRMDPAKTQKIEGTGLGLSICKQLVELMGGEMGLESEYGLGTSFHFEIPQKIANPEPMGKFKIKTIEEKEEFFRTKDVKILIVDDNCVNLMVAQGLLSQYKIQTEVVMSGQEAIDLLCSGNHYDMIMMDHMMPEMDGIETTQRIRKLQMKQSRIPIIALTANAVKGVESMFMNAGMDGFLAKPVQMPELAKILKKWIPPEKIEYVFEDDDRPLINPLGDKNTVFKDKEGAVYFPGLEFLDQEEGLGYCGGMESIYELVLKTYADAYALTIEKIVTYDQNKDFKNLAIEVHGVKGASKNIGADQVFEMAKGLEFASKGSDVDYIDTHMKEFMEHYTECVRRIYGVFPDDLIQDHFDRAAEWMQGTFRMQNKEAAMPYAEQLSVQKPKEGQPESLDMEMEIPSECREYAQDINTLLESISYFDVVSAGDQLTELIEKVQNDVFKKGLKEAKMALDKFSYDDAIAILQKYQT